MSKYGTGGSRLAVSLDRETRKQIETLSSVFRINVSNVISMAVARWFHNEPLVKTYKGAEEDSSDGNDHSGL